MIFDNLSKTIAAACKGADEGGWRVGMSGILSAEDSDRLTTDDADGRRLGNEFMVEGA